MTVFEVFWLVLAVGLGLILLLRLLNLGIACLGFTVGFTSNLDARLLDDIGGYVIGQIAVCGILSLFEYLLLYLAGII